MSTPLINTGQPTLYSTLVTHGLLCAKARVLQLALPVAAP